MSGTPTAFSALRCAIVWWVIHCFACALPAQEVPWTFPSNFAANLPAMPEFGVPATRDPTAEECAVIERMLEAAAGFCASHPEFAPNLGAFRSAFVNGRMRRGTLHEDFRIQCIQDGTKIISGGRQDIWFPPGGVAPGTGDILPPNILIFQDGHLDGNWPEFDYANPQLVAENPALACFRKAFAIVAVLHEGARMHQIGTVTLTPAAMEADCGFWASVINTFMVDVEVWTDLLANGVPGEVPCSFAATQYARHAVNEIEKAWLDIAIFCDKMSGLPCVNHPACN